jgi:hypothetical protein
MVLYCSGQPVRAAIELWHTKNPEDQKVEPPVQTKETHPLPKLTHSHDGGRERPRPPIIQGNYPETVQYQAASPTPECPSKARGTKHRLKERKGPKAHPPSTSHVMQLSISHATRFHAPPGPVPGQSHGPRETNNQTKETNNR